MWLRWSYARYVVGFELLARAFGASGQFVKMPIVKGNHGKEPWQVFAQLCT